MEQEKLTVTIRETMDRVAGGTLVMTLDERVARVQAKLNDLGFPMVDDFILAEEMRDAVLEEREACARIAEEPVSHVPAREIPAGMGRMEDVPEWTVLKHPTDIAAQIRARSSR